MVLEEDHDTGADPAQVVEAKGLGQVSDTGAIEAAADKVIAANEEQVKRYREGKKALLGFFMGQVMRELKGKGDPKLVTEVLQKKLGG